MNREEWCARSRARARGTTAWANKSSKSSHLFPRFAETGPETRIYVVFRDWYSTFIIIK